ncbi:Smr/MutS family protein, partial [Methylobacterium organophilum]|nr:Smr/MutS family protein [Methylobacterium organophilum]
IFSYGVVQAIGQLTARFTALPVEYYSAKVHYDQVKDLWFGLRRGRLAIEARIDLHGMVQAEAHAALTGFLLRARAAGHSYVLVVTGKGGPGYADAFSERGVLRRSVPHWLRGPDLRGIVLGFEEAARHHGGGGALYVRLRRR